MRRLIIIALVGLMIGIVILGAVGYFFFVRKPSNTEIIFAATEVGTPVGPSVTKDIGPAGGTLVSPDGRLTLTVSPNALNETVAFSIQPITNKAGNGLGLAYRLEPTGKSFPKPLELSVHYDQKDLEGTIPDVLALAYQDGQGAWHESKTVNQTKDWLTVATSHFSDWTFMAKMRVIPVKATVCAGKSQKIVLVGCTNMEERLSDKIRVFLWGEEPYGRSQKRCEFGEIDSVAFAWRADIGTVDNPTRNPVLYTAPSKKPNPNVAKVEFPYEVEAGRITYKTPRDGVTGSFISLITIVEGGYSATGQTADMHYSGVICDLEKPFTVNGSLINYKFNFNPTSATAGTATISASGMSVVAEGGGTYTIEGANTDRPRIALVANTTGYTAVGARSGGGTVYIDLVPLGTCECREK